MLPGIKGKGHPIKEYEGPGVEKYNSTLSLTSALVGVGCQRHVPAALPPGKTRHPLYRRLGETQGPSGRVRKIFTSPGFDLRTDQPVASRYTDYAIPAHMYAHRNLQSSSLFFDYGNLHTTPFESFKDQWLVNIPPGLTFKNSYSAHTVYLCGRSEKFSASTIDGNSIGKIFFYVGTYVISIHVKLQVVLSNCLFYTAL
jgi:hypothetical protein